MSKKTIREVFNDATTLEVNSILVDGITGCKMPAISIAFYETVSAWVEHFPSLIQRIERTQIEIDSENKKILTAIDQWMAARDELLTTFGIKEVPYHLLANNRHLMNVLNTDDLIKFRQGVNKALTERKEADELMPEISRLLKIQSRLQKLNLRFSETFSKKASSTESDRMADRNRNEMRKLWELKDGYIFAQNVVQLDGDIITRYNLRLYRDQRVHGKSAQLLNFHKDNVEAGMKHWHFIIETITSIARALTGIFAR